MKKNKILLQPSRYDGLPWKEIENLAKHYKVPLEYYGLNYSEDEKELPVYFKHLVLDLSGKNHKLIDPNECIHRNHHLLSLKDGKIFGCVIIANINHFNSYFNKNLEVCAEDFIDIYKINGIDELYDFMARPVPFCGYCDYASTTWAPNKPSKKDISEWT
jgi:hypothetical protein